MLCATYNIQYGKGKDGRYDLDRIVAELGDQDLIALQEVDAFVERSGMIDQVAEIAARLPHMFWVYGPGIDADASTIVDGRVVNRRRQFGNMVLARWPILASANHLLPKMALHSQVHSRRAMLETVIQTPIGALRFASVHFDHIGPQTRLPQIDAAKRILLDGPATGATWGGPFDAGWFDKPAPPMPEDIILMGDFNFPPDSVEYDRFLGEKTEHHGRVGELKGFMDAWVAAGHAEDEGVTISFNGFEKRIDHCFITPDLAGKVRRAWIDNDAQGSDHQPVFFEFADTIA
ncbi:MAG: endonuclease/exonuclease/phosphatase [Rhizobiaceae bacterium MnEN-MB40S]|nr:MAG: endonuclease/exonuclease/phosphatase [Rhizobiaceae bacterium MnEN-MB40S]